MPRAQFNIPEWLMPIYDRSNRYSIIYGGRGSGKSWGVCDFLLAQSFLATTNLNILCAREIQKSIDKSVHAMLKRRIRELSLDRYYHITRDRITNTKNGCQFFFEGLYRNTDSIKSIDSIDYLWIEEGQSITAETWRDLIPSIRNDDSQIIVTMNPRNPTDTIYRTFINSDRVPLGTYKKNVNWDGNPYFPKVLELERLNSLRTGDVDLHNHVWEGDTLEHSDAQIFRGKWSIEDFDEPSIHKVHYHYGLDFGYIDPLACIKCFIKDNVLYITHEVYKTRVDTGNIGPICEKEIPGFKTSKIVGDKSRPDTIVGLKRLGYNVTSSKGGGGSIEDGIAHIRGFDRVVIHPRCVHTAQEFKDYSYLIDKHSGEVTQIIDSKSGKDHLIDALRYALESTMKIGMNGYRGFDKISSYR